MRPMAVLPIVAGVTFEHADAGQDRGTADPTALGAHPRGHCLQGA